MDEKVENKENKADVASHRMARVLHTTAEAFQQQSAPQQWLQQRRAILEETANKGLFNWSERCYGKRPSKELIAYLRDQQGFVVVVKKIPFRKRSYGNAEAVRPRHWIITLRWS